MSAAGYCGDDPAAFVAAARALPPALAPTARAVLLVEPIGFRLSAQTAHDNAYMDLTRRVDPARALVQHRALAQAIERHARLPVRVFAGDPDSPDAVFPNNVFGAVPGRLIVGAMRHPERQRESRREDILAALLGEGRSLLRLDADPAAVSELTGPLVIDRARGLGFHGLGARCNVAGARAAHAAFALGASLLFPLAPSEYHTNVVLTVLAGRAALLYRPAVPDAVAEAIEALYGAAAIWLDAAEKAAFVANSIALKPDQVWMSAGAERALSPPSRQRLRDLGFVVHTVDIDEIEKAGGSLRCCVAELF